MRPWLENTGLPRSWMYWGQWASTTDPRDLRELEHVISNLLQLPGLRHTWEHSPLGKRLLDEDFVRFVDDILANMAT